MTDLAPTNVLSIYSAWRRRLGNSGVLASFVLAVVAPLILVGSYLWVVAVEQYASTVAFSVRKEEFKSSLDLFGDIPLLAGSSVSDTDILYEFLKSQELAAQVDAQIDLRALYSKYWPRDPVFAYDPVGTIEDLHQHLRRKVQIAYDSHTGLMTLRVLAFTPEDAQRIAQAIFDECSRMINELSAVAREDATFYAKEELDNSIARLKDARQMLTRFRLSNQIVDPTADFQGQMGVLNSLQSQLAESMIELDMLPTGLKPDDTRLQQAQRRIEVIRGRITQERAKFGVDGGVPGGEDYASLISQYERLNADKIFAEEAYRTGLAAYDVAQADARRQSRYLAAHIRPTLAEKSEYPERLKLLAIVGFFLTVIWATCILIYFSIRDRR